MKKLTCIIVEDEPLAAEVLVDYIQQIPFLELVGNFPDALYALEILKVQTIDVIFLDIHLPKLKGLDFIKTLAQPPQIILTTAYHQYAVESYDLAVMDYLLKPIEFSRFLKAANKLSKEPKVIKKSIETATEMPSVPFMFFPSNKKFVKIYLNQILYIESLKDYVKIHTSSQQLVTRYQIGEIEKLLKNIYLLRVHRSFLIAIDKIEAYSANEIEINGIKIPIGRSYKAFVQLRMQQYNERKIN